jgi:hypothetical protein
MRALSGTRQREAGLGDDWARPVVHWELEVVDAEAQRAFYASLFNWEIGDGPVMQIPAVIGDPSPGVAPTSARVIAAG